MSGHFVVVGHTVEGEGAGGLVTPRSGGSIGGQCPDGPGDDTQIRANVHTLALAFARRHLRNDTTSDAILTGASLPSGITKLGP